VDEGAQCSIEPGLVVGKQLGRLFATGRAQHGDEWVASDGLPPEGRKWRRLRRFASPPPGRYRPRGVDGIDAQASAGE
jgi:hypothetical protein